METHSNSDICRWADDRLAALDPDSQWQPDAGRAFAKLNLRLAAGRRRSMERTWITAGLAAVLASVLLFPAPRMLAYQLLQTLTGHGGKGADSSSAGIAPADARARISPQADRSKAPGLRLRDGSGKLVDLADFQGRVVLMNFWATWCAACDWEIPMFSELEKEYESRGLSVVGISVDEDWPAVKAYIDRVGMSYITLLGNDASARLYGVQAFPRTFILDRHGRIAADHGTVMTRKEYESEIRSLLEEP